jgi:hypothetical protein
VIPEIDIWQAAQLMLKRYGDKALEESAARSDELVAAGDDNGAAVWRRITAAVAHLANTTPAGCIDHFGTRIAVTFNPAVDVRQVPGLARAMAYIFSPAPPLDRHDRLSPRSTSAAPDPPFEIEHLGLRAEPEPPPR